MKTKVLAKKIQLEYLTQMDVRKCLVVSVDIPKMSEVLAKVALYENRGFVSRLFYNAENRNLDLFYVFLRIRWGDLSMFVKSFCAWLESQGLKLEAETLLKGYHEWHQKQR
jgi:hypothetical protein